MKDHEAQVVAHVNHLARLRDSGYPVSLDEMTPSEWVLLRLRDDHVEAYERQLRMAGPQFGEIG